MSQFSLENLRSVSTDPNQRSINELAKKLARFLAKDIEVNLDDEEDLIANGVQIDDGIKFNDTFYHREQFSNWENNYYPMADVDGGNMAVWLRGNHLGSQLLDRSQYYSNNASMYGDPKLVDGSFDMGYLGGTYKSLALKFNRPTSPEVNAEWLEIPDTAKLRVTGATTGFSLFFRIKIHSFAQQNSVNRHLAIKVDDDTNDNGFIISSGTDGKIRFDVSRANTDYEVTMPTGLSTNTLYDIFFTYAVSGNALKIYVNGSDTSAASAGGAPSYQTDKTDHDLYVFKKGAGATGGFCYADLYDFKFWHERVISSTEVTRFHTNKNSISNHQFGESPFANHCTPYYLAPTSFTATSFTPDSFTV